MERTAANELQRWSGGTPDRGRALHPPQRYAIISELGGGGMSTVHLAHDGDTGRVVAIKRIAARVAAMPDVTRRFAREASIVAQLRHPNIVETIAIERAGDTPTAIVTAYVRGASLRDVLATSGPLPVDRAVRVLRDIAGALAYAHARRIVHRDVKPANILIESDSERALLADFGIACESGALPDVVDGGLTIGTPAYMAPEQIDGGAVDARADVYALCVVAWEMLSGHMPWLGAPLADVLHRQRYESLPDLALLRPDIPVYLLRAINGGLAKDPAQRWRDGAELLRQLSPTPTPLVIPRREPAPLDATLRLDARAIPEPHDARGAVCDAAGTAGTAGAAGPRPRSMRILATTIGTIVVALALGGLAPHLSHATVAPRPVIDPELDSMLTLAVAPRPAAPTARPRHASSASAPCRTGTARPAARPAAPCATLSRQPTRRDRRARARRR